MEKPLLDIQNLSVDFITENKHSAAVRDLSLCIGKGEMVALVGASGSGKSVTSLAIMQLLAQTARVSGRALFAREAGTADLLALSASEINSMRGKEIAMIFQEPMTSLNPVLTCGQQVKEAIRLHRNVSNVIATQETIALFEKVRLPDPANMLHKYPHQLSGGQKQRVMIAMAMSCSPALLIADEPTTALDVTVQRAILELIRELQQQTDMSVLLITHDLGIAADLAHKVAVMYQGELVEYGNALEVLLRPLHPYTQSLLECRKGKKHTPAIFSALTAQAPFLKVDQLSVHYKNPRSFFGKPLPDFKALDAVSLEIHKGEMVGLVGESGSGKTTLGRTLLQLIRPTSGKVWLNGRELTSLKETELRSLRKEMQLVFQDPYAALDPRISAGEAIKEPLKAHKLCGTDTARKERVLSLLEKVQLDAAAYYKYPHQFSGGQRQRICMARALATDPSFLVFDESVSALDMCIREEILELLATLRRSFNFTALFIAHDLAVVHRICDRIMVMHHGCIVETGNADEVYYNPRHAYTRQLLEAVPGRALVE